ncbi:hypothetical protein I7I50_06322 [Histoplasma capsulatum G186AR]|uniref:Uncharacterized protein n=1 Tax=Ajellomyces capsulatus TaxID=5037 RepID=A0A8H7Z2S3_AJECA|nr:hypothetical protein I7I52_10603 [Histoplasma capsulatum]QSS67296.1 hypothetical protein I7I50_06322 [Histoplasma capsulatum G186AR]
MNGPRPYIINKILHFRNPPLLHLVHDEHLSVVDPAGRFESIPYPRRKYRLRVTNIYTFKSMPSRILVRWFEIQQRSNLDGQRAFIIFIQGHHSFPDTPKITPRIGYQHLSNRVLCFKKVRLTSRMPPFTSCFVFSSLLHVVFKVVNDTAISIRF